MMLDQKVLEESSSPPWMASAIYISKKFAGHLCANYRKLNKETVNDENPLPLPEVQERLSRSTVFPMLNLQSRYWELPVIPTIKKTLHFSRGQE